MTATENKETTVETKTETVTITVFGETRDVECFVHGDRISSVAPVVVGRFPTGTKIHRTQLWLWRRNANPNRPLRGETAAVVNGEEFIADKTLYTHNRNVGRITGWYVETTPDEHVARW